MENTHRADDGSDVPKIKKISSRTRLKTRELIPQALSFLLGKGRSGQGILIQNLQFLDSMNKIFQKI